MKRLTKGGHEIVMETGFSTQYTMETLVAVPAKKREQWTASDALIPKAELVRLACYLGVYVRRAIV